MPGLRDRDAAGPTLALLRRDFERRAWLTGAFQGSVPPCGELRDLDLIRARYATLSMISCGKTSSGLSGRAFFGAHVHAILQEEPEPSEFAIGFVKVRNGSELDGSVLRPMAQILRETLPPEYHLAEVRPAVFGAIAPGTTGAALETLLGEVALSIASTTFFDVHAGESKAYEAEVAMGRLDGRRTVEDVFRETRRSRVFEPAAPELAARSSRLPL